MPKTEKTCVRCSRFRPCGGRALCSSCYKTLHEGGGLLDYPRASRPGAEVVAEYSALKLVGVTRQSAAARMGMKWTALERALYRAGVKP